jgi:hypothetical protein
MKHLIILTESYKRYRVNENFEITQYENKDFSGGWLFQGIQSVRSYYLNPLPNEFIAEDNIKELPLTYKNGKPKYTVIDRDHGTTRAWGDRILSMRYETV